MVLEGGLRAESFGAYMRGERTLLDPDYAGFIDSKAIDRSTNPDIIKLGINMFDKSDPLYVESFSIEEEKGFTDIFLHGSSSSVQIKREEKLVNLSPQSL